MLNNSNSRNRENISGSPGEKGFTIVELIIAMIVFLIVTGSVYGVLLIAQRSRTQVNQQVQLTKNVRLALNIVGRDTFNAGFGYPLKDSVNLRDNRFAAVVGVPVDTGDAADTIPPVIAGDNINNNTFAAPATTTDQVTFLFKDSTFNLLPTAGPADKQVSTALNIDAVCTTCATNQVTIAGSNSSCAVNDIFVIAGKSGSTLGVVTEVSTSGDNVVKFGSTDVLGFNQNGTPTILSLIATPASMQRVKMTTYFVTVDGTLTRREFANTSTATTANYYVDEPLVYGVENFQIQYILADGTLSDNPSAGPNGTAGDDDDTQKLLSTVRQIRFTVNAKTTDLDSAGRPYRVTMTSTFATRNLGYNPS